MNRVEAAVKKFISLFAKPKQPGRVEELRADPKHVFTDYYRNNFWGNPESVSGAGSTMTYTENVRNELPKLWKEYRVETFLDAPCGDFNWFQAIQRPQGMNYLGGDIVEELVRQNQEQYGDAHTRFFFIDIIKDPLPKADMWMCRDCLFHFSYGDIFKTLANFARSDIHYLFTSIHNECAANADIVTGGARQLNLLLPPFNLPAPILLIDDWIPGFTVRRMGLWTREMIARSLA
ncbi:MAG: class I SAM-dependent methyltransferase [Chloroflexi bacterium]|nr:class I SAM-dependent methyltransferase [Chloroflexota bacterium]